MKTLLFDMYGVIIKESKGNFKTYIYSNFPETKPEYLKELYYNQASIGLIDSDEFFARLGFNDSISAKKDYIENYLTLDDEFIRFAEKYKSQFRFAILSNDVLAWNEYILKHYDIGKYFTEDVVSSNAHCRKPDISIYEIALKRIGTEASECIFIDNSVDNLLPAKMLGMKTILFNRDNEDYEGVTVNSFTELSDYFLIK